MGSEAPSAEVEASRVSPVGGDFRVLAAVALGGALGAPARYAVSLAVDVTPGTFPWGTFWTNMSGTFVVGVLVVLIAERSRSTPYLRAFAVSGFLGSYTTYSTFAVETDLLLRNGRLGVALAYVVASLGAGLAAAWSGMRLGRRWPA